MRRILAISIFLLITACEKENQWDCFTSYGDTITEYRNIDPFSSIVTESDIDIEYRFSETYGVDVTFGDKIIKHLSTEWTSSELRITNEARCNWVRDLSKKPKVVIYAPTFDKLEHRGVGDIIFSDTLHSQSFFYEQWNANGKVDLLLVSDLARFALHSGSTDVKVSGYAAESRTYSACGCKFSGEGFESPVTLVNNSSTQTIKVYSESYLFAKIGDRGDIYYAGSPDQIDTDIEGTGKLRPL